MTSLKKQKNYFETVSPVIGFLTKIIEGDEYNANSARLKNAQEAWNNWVEVQNKFKIMWKITDDGEKYFAIF